MYNREYYEDQLQEFSDRYVELTNDDTAMKKAVIKAAEEQDERLEKAFSENEYLKDFTQIAYEMQIETVDDFENYLTVCLGGKVSDGVRELRNKNNAFYSSSTALAQIERPLALRSVSNEEGDMVWEEKSSTVITWNHADGFTKNEVTTKTALTEKKLKSKLRKAKFFPKYDKRYVNDRVLPVHSVIAVLVCMAVLILPVLLSVISNEVEVANKEYDAYIRELNAEISELENEVALKRDMELINTLAREEYGMIDAELSQIVRAEATEDSFVLEAGEENSEQSMWVILLSAIGIIDSEN